MVEKYTLCNNCKYKANYNNGCFPCVDCNILGSEYLREDIVSNIHYQILKQNLNNIKLLNDFKKYENNKIYTVDEQVVVNNKVEKIKSFHIKKDGRIYFIAHYVDNTFFVDQIQTKFHNK